MRISQIFPLALTLFVTSVTAVQLTLPVMNEVFTSFTSKTDACTQRVNGIGRTKVNYDDVSYKDYPAAFQPIAYQDYYGTLIL